MILMGITFLFLAPVTRGVDWCRRDPACSEATWMCSGDRQSPLDIVSVGAMRDRNPEPFSFINLDSQSALTLIANKNSTVKVTLASEVSVSGGGLPEEYKSLEILLHWGRAVFVPGSEHTVDRKHCPTELHIVSMKTSVKDLPTSLTDSNGVAAFGVLTEVDEQTYRQTASSKTLTSYLTSIPYKDNISLTDSLDDLLPGVDHTEVYRYLGSLTTPNREESVIWTSTFKDPVKVSSDLIELFSTSLRVGNRTSPLTVDNYRNIQEVTYSSNPPTSHSFGLIFCALTLWMR